MEHEAIVDISFQDRIFQSTRICSIVATLRYLFPNLLNNLASTSEQYLSVGCEFQVERVCYDLSVTARRLIVLQYSLSTMFH